MDVGALRIEKRSEITGISTAQYRNGVRPSLEAKFLGKDCEAMPTPETYEEHSGITSAQLDEVLRSRHSDRVALDDLTVKNARLSLQIGNYTSHRILRSVGHVPLQQAREDGKCEGVRAWNAG